MGLTRHFASIEQEKTDKNQEKSAKNGKRVNADVLYGALPALTGEGEGL
jgi:hypothetical protein